MHQLPISAGGLGIAGHYAVALGEYLAAAGEAPLRAAYELGRTASAEGLGVLDLARVHHEALNAVLPRAHTPEQGTRLTERAANFLAECLSPYEMTHRGFREAHARLRELNERLEQQVVELQQARDAAEALAIELAAESDRLQAETAERKRAEEERGQLLARQELARTREEMVVLVSHELRTPLTNLVGFAELLLTRDIGEAERREFLEIMHREARRLTALTNDFLDLKRLESGHQALAPRPVDLRTLLAHATAAAGDDPARPLVLDVPNDLPPANADPGRIEQVVANLLSNARKYSPAGGAVCLLARRADGLIEVAVRDRGLGIPPEAQQRLFEKFYRVDNRDRRAIRGTGLGLAICHKIIEAHGGRIWAESEGLGMGATFRFTLPVAEVGAAARDQAVTVALTTRSGVVA